MGSSKKQTVGHRYLFGLHMGLSRGPLDEIVEIRIGDREAWKGSITKTGRIFINKPDLFGGDKGEGGIKGKLDVLMGDMAQAVMPVLSALHGAIVPAFRGVTTQYFDGQITANNPYPKPWKMRTRRALAGWDGATWYPEKAVIWLGNGAVRAMNPAHILVECLTNRDWGRGLDRGLLDDASYRRAADALSTEGFGLCLRWNRQSPIAEFMQVVIDHIGAAQYVDRATGRLTLKLIRDDYRIEDLPLFDYSSGLLAIEEDEVAAPDGAVNQVIVTWYDPTTDEERQARVQDLAGIQATGGVASSTMEYKGLPTADLAARVGMRDLTIACSGLKRLKLKFDRRAGVLAPGGVFRIRDPLRGIENLVLRVGTFDDGKLAEGTITVAAVQDVFGLPATVYLEPQPPVWTPPNRNPQPSPNRRLMEASYRDLATTLNAAALAALPADTGAVASVAEQPTGLALNYVLTTRVGNGEYTEAGVGDWCPTAVLAEAMTATTIALQLAGGRGLDQVTAGTAALIEDEVVRVVAIDPQAQTATFARGCADTVPMPHAVGARIWFFDDYAAADSTDYSVGETVQAKLLTRTSSALLDPALAPVDTIKLAQRQARPYPPGDLKLNGQRYPASIDGDLAVAWAHRDRRLQADQLVDHGQGSIGPEAGTAYVLRLLDDIAGSVLESPAATPGTGYTAALKGVYRLRTEVGSTREGLTSWQKAAHTFDFKNGLLRTETADELVSETGDYLLIE
ncbi:phage tail protein [Lysobacter sp. ISL-50]|uniref:phage tail protein n=1 Tax=unclassified Lysobacter TaxID=2635362 RepID=UPI001BE9FFD4|nr:phage tail protein [Lysobacter sp. ISL-42]MBT2749901.1 phage tail protein [Lysobacter sp. ISL-50]MBT2781229.1 phage tail protein [Lysobacter sp. ISL-52]